MSVGVRCNNRIGGSDPVVAGYKIECFESVNWGAAEYDQSSGLYNAQIIQILLRWIDDSELFGAPLKALLGVQEAAGIAAAGSASDYGNYRSNLLAVHVGDGGPRRPSVRRR